MLWVHLLAEQSRPLVAAVVAEQVAPPPLVGQLVGAPVRLVAPFARRRP